MDFAFFAIAFNIKKMYSKIRHSLFAFIHIQKSIQKNGSAESDTLLLSCKRYRGSGEGECYFAV